MTEIARKHDRFEDLVAALGDGELPPGEERAVREHLLGCARCQRELALQHALARALALDPAVPASAALRRRIEQMAPAAPHRRWRLRHRPWAAAAAASLLLLYGAGNILLRGRAAMPVAESPLLRDALADCNRATARNFPRKADLAAVGEGLPFPVRALDRPDAVLFSTWKTTLAGSPAAGLAYRWRGGVVVQYAIAPELIQQQQGLAEPVRRIGYYAATEGKRGIVATLGDGSGTVLVGDASVEELRRLIL